MNDSHFEAKKNMKAGTYTAFVLGLLLLILVMVGWTTPSLPAPIQEQGIEVNLGNSDQGLGNDQPFLPGKPAPQDQQQYTPPKTAPVQKEEVKDPQTNEKDPDAPEIKKPLNAKPEATKISEKVPAKKIIPKKTEVTSPPVPAPPHPKAVFHGVSGTGTGGNEADSYKKGGNEGIAGGKGDQGKPGGDPNSKNYTGNGGNGNGVIVSGDRRILSGNFRFTGDFDENATIFAEIKVSPDGHGQFIRTTKGSTTGDRIYVDMIIQKLHNITFNTASDESMITVQFVFKIRN
jgi:hypothetical protein